MLLIVLLSYISTSFSVSEEEHLAKMIGKPPPPKDMTIESLYDPDECEMTTKKGHQVKVHYKGRYYATDEEFDNSYERRAPFEFTIGNHEVIKG